METRISRPHSCAARASSSLGSPRKTIPNALVKQAAASPPMRASPPMDKQPDDRQRRRRGQRRLAGRQVDEELAHEAVEGRQAGDGGRADQKGRGGPRHALRQAAEPVDLARVRRVQHRPGPQEEQPLEQRVVDHVEQAAGKPQGGDRDVVGAPPQDAHAEPQGDDADVLHAVIGEQPLQVVLGQGEQHAEHPGEQPDGDQRPAPPRFGRAEEGQDPEQPVDAGLDHHAGHHGRHVRRRRRVRLRQPDVQRHESRLGPEADQRQEEGDADRRGAGRSESLRNPRSPASRIAPPAGRRAPAGRPCRGGWPPGRSSPPSGPPAARPRTSPGRRRRAT